MRSSATIGLALSLMAMGACALGVAGCGELSEGSIGNVAYTPDGRLVVFTTGETQVLDADAHQSLASTRTPWSWEGWANLSSRLRMSADGSAYAIGSGKAVDVYALDGGTRVARIVVNDAPEERSPIVGVALSNDGALVAVAVRPIYLGAPRLGIWRVADQSLVVDIHQPAGRDLWSWGAGLAFSPEGDVLYALASGETSGAGTTSTAVTAWNVADGSLRWENAIPSDPAVPGSGAAHLLSLSPDGTTLATGGSELLRWEAKTSARLLEFHAPALSYFVQSIAFSPDGRDVVITHGLNVGTDPQIFGPDGSLVHEWPVPNTACGSAVFSPDGTRVAASCAQWLKIWDVASGNLIQNRKVTGTVY